MSKEEKNIQNYDFETQKYIIFMCKKCKFYDKREGCLKKRIIRKCAKEGLKNKE